MQCFYVQCLLFRAGIFQRDKLKSERVFIERFIILPFNTDFRHFKFRRERKHKCFGYQLLNCATIHDHPRPAINLQPPPTLNHNFVVTTHDQPFFCSPKRIQEQSKFIRQYLPNTNKKFFSECRNSFYSQFTHY